jgi:hypothetical protein
MQSLRLAGRRIAATLPALALLLLAAGCASDGDHSRPPPGGQARNFTPIGGQESFFNGAITAEVLVGAMTGFTPGGPGPGGGGSGGRKHHGGGMHGGGPGGAPRSEGGWGGMEGPDGDPASGGNMEARRADAMGSPPVMIHLRFTNHGPEKADLVITDFLSPLGNFVVHPDQLALDPGQSLEVEPMTSRLAGEVSGGEVSLSLKLGKQQETKTITLELKPEAVTTPQ